MPEAYSGHAGSGEVHIKARHGHEELTPDQAEAFAEKLKEVADHARD